jgi:hypothetical protein
LGLKKGEGGMYLFGVVVLFLYCNNWMDLKREALDEMQRCVGGGEDGTRDAAWVGWNA